MPVFGAGWGPALESRPTRGLRSFAGKATQMAPEAASKRSDTRPRRNAGWQERLLVGAMLALALFSFEAGLAHIALARDGACRESLASARVGPAAGSECLSELELAATNALARGPAGIFFWDKVTLLTWALSGLMYAALGGACAQLEIGRAVLAYLGIHAFLFVVVSFVLFIGPHAVA
jgi:hypothetical protein